MKINTNQIIITGNLCRDAELKYTQNSKTVLQFTVACNRQGMNNESVADFFPVVLWGKSAEALAKYMTKGKGVLVKGRLQTRSYEAKDGTKKTVYEIVADAFAGVELLGGGSSDRSGGAQPQSYRQPAQKQRQNDFTPQDDYGPIDIADLDPAGAPPLRGDTADIPF